MQETPTLASARDDEEIRHRAATYIAGGVVSLNRKVDPPIVFASAHGSRLVDHHGRSYIDYHAAFAPYLLGHNHPVVNQAVRRALDENWSLLGSGTNAWEARLAELLCQVVPSLELVQITNTGSEATAHAIRLSRAWTGRDDVLLMLGGYNGWHNEVARSVFPTLEQVGPRVSPGEYAFLPMSAGIPESTRRRVHIVNFNDLESVAYVLRRYPIACVLMEPVMQNVGVVLPDAGYLQQMVDLCEAHGTVCVFDEVKTGFRSALGGYQSVVGVRPHLSVFGKAVANGYPMGVVGGRRDLMEQFAHPDPAKRVLIAGTYNAHPLNTAAAIATVELLKNPDVYHHLEAMSARLQSGLETLFAEAGLPALVVRNASAHCVYFCERPPRDLHDVLLNHDFDLDRRYRRGLVDRGVYQIPLPAKQGSVSHAHTAADIDQTLEITRQVVKTL